MNFGWDLGGAHLKVAAWHDGRLDVTQQVCRLWLGLHELEKAVQRIENLAAPWDNIRSPKARHWVTMTGEMADIFPSRRAGVEKLIDAFVDAVGGEISIYSSQNTAWLTPAKAWQDPLSVASMNWHASARWVAKKIPNCLFMDVGSTTSDIIPIGGGKFFSGLNDAERLVNGELVYVGFSRTSLMALGGPVPVGKQWIFPMAEHFANTADIFRVLNEAGANWDMQPTCDGGRATVEGSLRRIARMVGRDMEDMKLEECLGMAQWWRGQVMMRLHQGVKNALAVRGTTLPKTVVAAGVGRSLIRTLAHELHLSYIDFHELLPRQDEEEMLQWASNCAPAVAMVFLATP